MKNKNLQSLLRTITDQQAQQDQRENGAEFENLDQDLAAKLKGGQEASSADTFSNDGCQVTNFGCSAQ